MFYINYKHTGNILMAFPPLKSPSHKQINGFLLAAKPQDGMLCQLSASERRCVFCVSLTYFVTSY